MAVKPLEILSRHYNAGSLAYYVVLTHSVLVAHKAREVASRYVKLHPGAEPDLQFLEEIALLHDIGIKFVHAPEIGCVGPDPYIRHGIRGRELLEQEGLPRHALAGERHTGAGITVEEVNAQELPLPRRDYLPLSLEEKILCIADKFYRKTSPNPWKEKSLAKVCRRLERFGPAVLSRWHDLWNEICGVEASESLPR